MEYMDLCANNGDLWLALLYLRLDTGLKTRRTTKTDYVFTEKGI